MQPLRILVVATKAPWPPIDGGRLVLLNTIEALTAAGHLVHLVAPCRERVDETSDALARACTPHLVGTGPRSLFGSLATALVTGTPVTTARHSLPAVREVVETVLDTDDIDVVHAEQLHSLPQANAAHRRRIPVVHRAHNVESVLWTFAARHRRGVARSLVSLEARRMSIRELYALDSTAGTIALTEPDHRRLAELLPGASIHTVAAPFAGELAPGAPIPDGDPAVVTITSATWAPSRVAVDDLAARIWPAVRDRLPRATLHVFGGGRHLERFDGVVPQPPPDDSRTAFPAGAIAVIPERHPTGVPMKGLEAWARGLPLVTDAATAEALGAADGVELLIARDPSGYADALARLVEDDDLRRRVVDGGRRALTERHDPARVADQLARIYRWAVTR